MVANEHVPWKVRHEHAKQAAQVVRDVRKAVRHSREVALQARVDELEKGLDECWLLVEHLRVERASLHAEIDELRLERRMLRNQLSQHHKE